MPDSAILLHKRRPMLKAAHIGKYRDLALLLTRYGLKDFYLQPDAQVMTPGEAEGEDKPLEPDVAARAAAFVAALKAMGPTYVKFGQVLSTRHDIVPREYIEALEELQNEVEPFAFEQVKEIVESELNVKISRAFSAFDETPIAAGSLAQVHRAAMLDGRDVAVKVQRPDIRATIEDDLQVFAEIASFLEQHTAIGKKLDMMRAVEQGGRMLLGELDFRQEARNIDLFRRNLSEFEDIYVPYVIHDFTTARVLTAEFVRGKKVSKLTPLALIDHDYSVLAATVTRAYLKQVCVDGIWHSDPHPGNVFVHEGKLILLDFGMISRIGTDLQDEIIKLLLSITENRGRDAAEVCISIGTLGEKFIRDKFVRDISDLVTTYYDADLRRTNTGRIIFALINVANGNDLRLPGELALLAKTLLHLDGITRKLDPDFSPPDAIRDYAQSLITQKIAQKFHPRNLYSPLLDFNELIIELPRRTREILDQAATGKATVNLKFAQMDDLLSGMHKIANRIAIGAIVAALIIASALMMRVDTSATIFGYPALAMLGYLAASAIGFYMAISGLLKDRRDKEKARLKSKTQ